MATSPKPTAPVEDDSGKKRTRSPAYPFINLEAAIKRAKEFYDEETRNAASVKVAVKHWGYEEKSSGGLQTIAALISFGLLKDEGIGEKRKLQLTQNALRVLLDQRPDSTERAQLIKQAALTPKIHRDLWKKWGNELPSEHQFRYTLTAEWEPPFNEKSVDGFIREYKDTIAFAKLSESDKVASEDGNSEDSEGGGSSYVPKVGEYVQWESQGALQFKEPARVLRISTDGGFAFVEGTSTGLPVNELRRADAPSTPLQPQIVRAPLLLTTNMQEDVYSIPEGRIVVQWPASLSAESVQEVKDYLKLLERKITRSVEKDTVKGTSE
jgi:hypothetical protein